MSERSAEHGCVDADGHAARVLEFDDVLEHCAGFAATAGGRARVLALLPSADAAQVAAEQACVRELRNAVEAGLEAWPLDGVHDVDAELDAASRPGSVLDALELRRIAESLAVAGRLRRFLDDHAGALPLTHARATTLQPFDAVVDPVLSSIDERGEVLDQASPDLRRLRRELVVERDAIRSRLEKLMRDVSDDPYVTLRNDRYVIPVRVDAATSVRGIVHDRSGSGATLFVEPLEILEANNEVQRLQDAERREIRRLLETWTRSVGGAAMEARQSLAAVHDVDAVRARALWGRRMGAVDPRIGAPLRLVRARHPLLHLQLGAEGRAVVPLDLDAADARVLVITGPNTGGKTVALKTVGLLVLLHQAGLPVPADPETRLPVFRRVFADIGDEQSIEAAQSTFSSHVRHVIGVVGEAGPHTLALLDEFMAGTDPEEGAALAQAILQHLSARGGVTLATTHLSALKVFAHAEPGIANASMAFDATSRAPLFELRRGVPGSSNALAIASRLGLPPDILAAAEAARGASAQQLESLLQALTRERTTLAEAIERATASEAEARRIREEHAASLSDLMARRRALWNEARRESAALVTEAQARIERVVRELREAHASGESIRAAQRDMQELAAEQVLEPEPEAGRPIERLETPLQPGHRVWVQPWGREGIVEGQPVGGRVPVRIGNLVVSVGETDLRPLGGAPAPEPAPAPPRAGGFAVPEVESIAGRLDLRGLEREAAREALDSFLDQLVLQGTHTAVIVHGKGTGVLRKTVHEHLAHHSDVAEFRLGEHGEGDSGVTIVRLR